MTVLERIVVATYEPDTLAALDLVAAALHAPAESKRAGGMMLRIVLDALAKTIAGRVLELVEERLTAPRRASFRLKEVAAMTGLTVKQLRVQQALGRLDITRVADRTSLVMASDLERFLDALRQRGKDRFAS